MIDYVDVFVFLDTVQFTRRDWRTRNRIRLNGEDAWLSVPVNGSRSQLINEVRVANFEWSQQHERKIRYAYASTLSTDSSKLLKSLYGEIADIPRLTDINQRLIEQFSAHLGIETRFVRSEQFEDSSSPSLRLAQIASACGASEYWTGPAAQSYLDPVVFQSFGVSVKYFDLSLMNICGNPEFGAPGVVYSIVHDLATVGIDSITEKFRYRG